MGDEIGGHHVSGHVHTTATITSIKQTDNNRQITMQVHHSHSLHIMECLLGVGTCSQSSLAICTTAVCQLGC